MKTYTEQDLREALAALAPTDTPPVDMWPRVRSRIARRRRMRLALAAGGLAAATTVALVAWPGAGRDSVGPSEGAKSVVVTLGLRGSLSHRVTAATLHVLRKRLDGLGISGATISVHNEKLFAVTVPSTDLAKLNGLADRGDLQLRQVLQVASRSEIPASLSVGTAPDLSHAELLFAHSTCNEPSNRPRRHPAALAPADYLVACSVDGASIYLLGPSRIRTADVASADAQTGTTGAWFVDVSLTQAGAEEWKNLTQTAGQQPFMPQCRPPSGCNGIGVVVDGHIVSVPVVQGGTGLNGGRLQISVRSQEEARALATDLTHPLRSDLNYLSVGPAS